MCRHFSQKSFCGLVCFVNRHILTNFQANKFVIEVYSLVSELLRGIIDAESSHVDINVLLGGHIMVYNII